MDSHPPNFIISQDINSPRPTLTNEDFNHAHYHDPLQVASVAAARSRHPVRLLLGQTSECRTASYLRGSK